MKIVMPKRLLSIVDGVDDHAGDLWLAKVQRTGAGVVKKAIQGDEGLSGGRRRWEVTACREAVAQPPGNEHSFANGVQMRKAPRVKGRHQHQSGQFRESSQRPINNRPQVDNL